MISPTKNSKMVPFDYIIEITLSANGLGSKNITLAADSWFTLLAYRASTDAAGNATDFAPNYFSCMITDQGTGRQLQSTKTPQRILAGTAYMGQHERIPISFAPQTILQFDFQNLSAEELDVTFGLIGYKDFGMVGTSV